MSDTRATVIFDFDGTLANSIELIFNLYNEHAEEFGYLPLTREEIPKMRRMGYKKAMKAKKIRYTQIPKIVIKVTREMRARMEEVEPYEGIVDMLQELIDKGFSIGVLTSNQAGIVKEFFKRHNFPQFDFIVSEKTYFGKEKALKRIIKHHGLNNDQVLYVGDEPRDVTASHKAGVEVIAVSWGIGGNEGFEDATPDKLVHTPKELLQTITDLAQE